MKTFGQNLFRFLYSGMDSEVPSRFPPIGTGVVLIMAFGGIGLVAASHPFRPDLRLKQVYVTDPYDRSLIHVCKVVGDDSLDCSRGVVQRRELSEP